jgi:hypothetical protein
VVSFIRGKAILRKKKPSASGISTFCVQRLLNDDNGRNPRSGTMAWLSNNEMWEAFGTRALFWAGIGSDFGEVKTTIDRIGAGNLHDWHREWTATAERIESIRRRVRQAETFR